MNHHSRTAEEQETIKRVEEKEYSKQEKNSICNI